MRAKFKIYRLRLRDSDWLDFIHFSEYKYKIRSVSILRQRKDQALNSISTILKCSAQIFLNCKKIFVRSRENESTVDYIKLARD